MGQNKFDTEFRQKLNAREIQPTDKAWDRLDAMLTVAENKKPARNRNWLYIAAGFLGFILIATIFFSREKQITKPVNEVVIENVEKPSIAPEIKPISPLHSNGISPEISNPVADNETSENPQAQQIIQKEDNLKPVENHAPRKDESAIAANDQRIKNIENPKPTIKAPEVNVDELLALVNQSTKDSKKSTVQVDAGSLLSQVDGELDLSFREKVIRTVGKNYKNVKVAIVNRNQE